MAFAEAGAGDADELRAVPHLLDRPVAGVTHRGAETADQLVDHIAGRAAIGDMALDAFGHELVGALDFLLKITVGRAARHGADASHAAIALVAAALVEHDLARR